jgi:hypothetical protein
MGFDSTANLLFTIGADTGNAEGNIQRFRTLLGKDLEGIKAEVSDWSNKVFGNLATVQGQVTAIAATSAAVLAGAAAALASYASHAADAYAEYVGEIGRGSKMTGIAAEQMSGLRMAVTYTGGSYDALITGLTRFSSTIVKAAEGGDAYAKTFGRLGISEAQVAAGEKNMLPLLMSVADWFHQSGSAVERAAVARELFGRGGAELVGLLRQGADGIQKFTEKAREMGLEITGKDLIALKEYKVAVQTLKEQHEALEVAVGRATLPIKERWEELKSSAIQTAAAMLSWKAVMLTLASPAAGVSAFVELWRTNFQRLKEEVAATVKAMGALGEGKGLGDAPKEATKEFYGLSSILDTVRGQTAANRGEEEKFAAELEHIQNEIAKTTKEYDKLRASGEMTAESAKRESAALAALSGALADLIGSEMGKILEERKQKIQQFNDDLVRRAAAQMEQTEGMRISAWQAEMAGLRDRLDKEKTLTLDQKKELYAGIDALERAGLDKIAADRLAAERKSGEQLQAQIDGQQEQTYGQQVAAWEREIARLREDLRDRELLTAAAEAKLQELRQVGLDRIARDQGTAYAREVQTLQNHLGTMLRATMTHQQLLEAEYQKDLAAFSDTELRKVLLTAKSEAEAQAIRERFAQIRGLITKRYEADLQMLQNSQGWQGVFGNKFAQAIRGNEALLKEWQQSTNQALMLVRVTFEALDEMGQRAFDHLAQGMGSGIAHAFMYQQSIGQAMRAALASTLEMIASESIAWAIYSTALGFIRLAQHDYPAATAAFTSAAIWGGVGATAALLGRAVAPSQAGAGAPSAAGGGASGAGAPSAAPAGSNAQQGPNVQVIVNGHIFGVGGIDAVAAAINDAVLNRNVQLTATNTTTGQVVRR